MIPRRRKKQKMGLREPPQYRSASYMQYVRGFECAILGKHDCLGRIESHHVRQGTDGGAAQKPSDWWCVPLCSGAHEELHRIGQAAFDAKYKIKCKEVAQAIWQRSPHAVRYRMEGKE